MVNAGGRAGRSGVDAGPVPVPGRPMELSLVMLRRRLEA